MNIVPGTRVITSTIYRVSPRSPPRAFMNELAFAVVRESLLKFARNFSPPLLRATAREKKVSWGRGRKGGNERGSSRTRGGVKRMRGANAFIRSVTITPAGRSAGTPVSPTRL